MGMLAGSSLLQPQCTGFLSSHCETAAAVGFLSAVSSLWCCGLFGSIISGRGRGGGVMKTLGALAYDSTPSKASVMDFRRWD